MLLQNLTGAARVECIENQMEETMSTISGITNSYITTMLQNVKKPSADEMFSKIDTDGDGSISEAELTTMQDVITSYSIHYTKLYDIMWRSIATSLMLRRQELKT